MSEKGNSSQDYTQFGDGTDMSSPGVPIANQYDAQVPNESLRGAARYLGSLVNRFEADPISSINYRASYVYNKFPTFNDVNATEQSANVSYDLFHKILGTDNTRERGNAEDYTVQNSDVARLNYEPNYLSRFMYSSLGVNLKESPFDTNSTSLVPGVKASYTSLSKNLAVNLPDDIENRALGQNLDYYNPASVAVIRERMFGQTAGFTLTGFSSRIQPADKISPSPIIIGAAYTALEESIKHRSQSDLVKAIVGFQSRPDSSFYQMLLSGQTTGNADRGLIDTDGKPRAGVSLNATFFQFQNTDIIQTLYNPGISFNIVTQQLGRQDFETENDNKVRILAGNEIILNGTQSLDTNETVLGKKEAKGINYHNSFHPKLGYVTLIKGTDTYEIAFIGTQNITAATSRHSTIESMLFVQKGGVGISSQLFEQIKEVQDYFASESFSDKINNFYGKPVKEQIEGYWDITKALNSKLASSDRQYLFFNDEIFGTRFYDTSENDGGNLVTSYNSIWNKEKEIYVRDYERDYADTLAKSTPSDLQRLNVELKEGKYVQLLEKVKGGLDENGNRVATDNNLIAVVSFDYINKIADFDTGGQHAFTRVIYELAEQGKVQVVMSASEYQKAMNNTLSTAVDTKLLSYLAERGALNLSVTGKHHDKSIAVFDKTSGSLKALAIGSANPTRSSIGLKRGGGGDSVIDNGGNIEVAAVIGLNNLDMINKGQLEDEIEQKFLTDLRERIQPHYFGLTGGAFNIEGFNRNRTNIAKPLSKAYKTESPALLLVKEQERVANIIKLKTAINNYTQTGSDPNSKYGSIIATLRYEPQLRARVKYVNQGEWGKLPDNKTDHPVLKGMNYTDAPIGLRITVTGPDKFHQLSFDATVTEEGNIVIPDLNKIINGAIWVNKTNSPITIFDKAPEWDKSFISKRTINPGDPGTQLTPFETLLAFAETVQRSFIYQEEFGLVDIMFRDSVREDRNKVITQIKSLFEDAFTDALPEQFSFSYDKSTTVNLKTILASLSEKRMEGGTSREKDTAFISILNQVAEYMTTETYGSSIINRASTSADARKKLIMESLIEVFNIESEKPSQLMHLDDMVADRFLRKLLIGNAVLFNDIKKQLIVDIEDTRAKYKSASLTQARTLLDELLSSFLAVHEETYAYYQGQERLGIFGETTSFDMYGEDSTITAQYKAGLLNPLAISHSTQVAAPGVLYRSLAATSYGDTLMLPGFGGLKQLTVVDSDLSSGASVGQSFLSGMGKSSPGFSVISKDQTKETLLLMLYQLNDIKPSEDIKLDNQDTFEDSMQQVINLTFGAASQLIYTPFEKLEQLTQRIKNVVGFRPALEFSQDFAISLINLFEDGDETKTRKVREYFGLNTKTTNANITSFADYLESYDPNNLNSNSLLEGQLRFSMPSIQHEEVGKAIELLKASGISDPTYADVQEYFRRLLLKQGNVQHGFIGGAKYKRFALTLGTSFMGDFSYLNPAYQYKPVLGGDLRTPIYGKLHNLRIKFNPERVDNVPQTITSFIKIFGEYGAVAITEKIGDRGPGLYKINAYNQGSAVLGEQIGEFTDTGLVKLKMDLVKVYHKGNYGPRPEPITFKVPAWPKRTEGGMTYIAPSPNLVDTARTTQIIELDTYTFYRPGSSSRFGGGGLAKGPVVYLEPEIFSSITNSIKPNLLPQSFQKDSLYGLGSMGTFKGVNVETGLVLLQDDEFRSRLIKDDKQLLVSLAMLFSKDEEVKTSLIDYLREEVKDTRGAASLLLTKGADISEATIPNKGKIDKSVSKNTLAYTASGLLMLAGQEAVTSLDFGILKKAVAEALKAKSLDVAVDLKTKDGGYESVNINLAENLGKLINLSTEQAYTLKEGKQNFYIFNDSNQITRGLGVLAHMFYLTSQIFNPDRKTVSGLYEIGLNNQELYIGKETQQIAGFTTEDYRSFVNQTLRAMGYTPKDIEDDEKNFEYNLQLMNLAQTRLDNQFVIETINDSQISQSLVASGMRDVVKQEYQFYIGMMNKKLNEYRNIMGEQGVSIQQAYLEAIAVSEGDMNAMVREQTLSFRLAMSQVDTFRGERDYSSPGAVLRYQDLRLRDLALLFSPSLMDNSSKLQRGGVDYRRDFEGSVLNVITSFQPQHIEDSLLLMASNMNHHQEYLAEVTSAGYSKGLIAMSKLLQSQLNRRDVDINSSYGKAVQTALDNLTKSQRIVLPYIEFHQTEDGRFIGAMRPVTDHNPTTGILLGSDFVSRIGQSFGDFETEIMKAQVSLVETLNRAQPVLEKFMQNTEERKVIPVFSEHEVRLIMDLRAALDMSGRTLIDIPITDISRQYAGDHESMSGAVGIATNSFVLRPDEVLLGKRYLRIAGKVDMEQSFQEQNSIVGTAINKLTNDLITENKNQQSIKNSITYLLASFGVIDSDDDYETWKSRVQTDYDSFFSKLDSAESKNFLSQTLGLTGTLSETDIAKQILFKARLYTDILGFSPLLTSEAEQNIGISSQILQEILLDTVGEDFKNKDIDTILRRYKNQEFKDGSFTLEKLAYLSAGFTFSRTGQPGGSSGIDSDSNEFTAIHAYKYLQRVKDISGGAIKVDLDRLSTGVIVPSNSRLISGLGDYDGDSYRLTMKQITASENVDQMLQDNEKYRLLKKQIDTLYQDKKRVESLKVPYQTDLDNRFINGDFKVLKQFDPSKQRPKNYIIYDTYRSYDYAKTIIDSLVNLSGSSLTVEGDNYYDVYTQYQKAKQEFKKNKQLSQTNITITQGGVTHDLTIQKNFFKQKIDLFGSNVSLNTLFNNRFINKSLSKDKNQSSHNFNLTLSSIVGPAQKLALFNYLLANDSNFRQQHTSKSKQTSVDKTLIDYFNKMSNADYLEYRLKLIGEGIHINKEGKNLRVKSTHRIINADSQYNKNLRSLYDYRLYGIESARNQSITGDDLSKYYKSLNIVEKYLNNFSQGSPEYSNAITNVIDVDQKELNKITTKASEEIITNIKDNLKSIGLDSNIDSTTALGQISEFVNKLGTNDTIKASALENLIRNLDESITNSKSITDIHQNATLLSLMGYITNKLESDNKDFTLNIKSYLNQRLFDTTTNLLNSISDIHNFTEYSDEQRTSIINEFKDDQNIYKTIKAFSSQEKKLRKEINQLKDQLASFEVPLLLTGLNPAERYRRKQEARRLKDLERFLKSYTNLPAFMFSKVDGNPRLTTGELIGFISQKYDFGNIEDAKKFTQSSIIQTLIVRANTEDLKKTIDLDDITDKTLKTIIKDTLKLKTESIEVETLVNKMGIKTREVDKEGKKTDNVTNIAKVTLATLKAYHDDSDKDFMATFSRVQKVTQQSQGLDVIDKKLLGRHLNTLLTPEEFTVATSVIGLAGTDLIGRAYNTLIPLLDTITIEQSFMYSQVSEHMKTALTSTVKDKYGSKIDIYKHLRTQLGVVSDNDKNNAETLEAARQNRIKIRNRFAGTLSILSNFQQIVRDAIKAKEGGSILERFHEYTNYGEDVNSLLNILTSSLEEGESSHAQEKRMRNAMSSFLKTSMGPQLDTNNDIENTIHNRLFSINPKHQKDTFSHILDVSEAVTGFGALYYLDSYARTEQNENLYEKFITNSLFGDQSEYFKDWAKTQLGSQKDGQPLDVKTIDWSGTEYKHLLRNFIGKQIIDLMQRTQVSFSISSMKDENVSIMFKHLQKMVETFETNLKTNSDLQDKKVARQIDDQVLYSLEQFTEDDIKGLLGIKTLTESENLIDSMKIMDAEHEKMNQDEIAQQFRKQYEIYKIYEELSGEEGADQKKLQYQAVASMMLEQMKYRDDTYNVLTNDTIEYLRYAAIDLSLMTSEDVASLGAENKIKLASRFAYTQMLRGLRSGKITDTATALEASQFKLGSVLAVLNENGITINDLFGESESFNKTELQKLIDNQERFGMAYVEEGQQVSDETKEGLSRLNLTALLGSMVYTTGLDEEANKELLKFMISSHEVGKDSQGEARRVTGFQLIAEQSAGLATLEKLTQTRQRAYETGDYTLAEAIDARLESYRSSDSSDFNTFNNPTLLDVNDYDLDTALAKQAEDNVQKIIAETQENIINKQDEDNKRRLGVMQAAPIAGILAGPLLFALASSDLKMDERVAMFAYDVFQGAAELSTRPNTTYSQYVGTQVQGTYGFRMARIGQSMQTYGYMYGAGIGLSSELMYRGIGELADIAIGATLGRRVAMSPNLGTVGAAAAAEVLAAVLSQAVTRAISGKIARQVKKDYEEQQNYAAIKQRLSKERLEAYYQQGEAQLEVYDSDKGHNVAVVEQFDQKTFNHLSEEEINEYTKWYAALYNGDGAEISTVFEDPTDPNAYTTADQLIS